MHSEYRNVLYVAYTNFPRIVLFWRDIVPIVTNGVQTRSSSMKLNVTRSKANVGQKALS